ncbi:MAG TPA: DUF167 domain-containing protein [bacterium]|nr:DUF167 domain-containing protein [bacterium]
MDQWITEKPGGVLIRVRVKPRGGKDKIEGPGPDGALIVRLAAPPVDNQANQSLISILAKALRLPKSAISIHSGEKSKNKTVMVSGINAEQAEKVLLS